MTLASMGGWEYKEACSLWPIPLLQGIENFRGDLVVLTHEWKQDDVSTLPTSWQSTWEGGKEG